MATNMETINGVEVPALKDAIDQMRKQPRLGRFQFRAHNHWNDKSHNHTTMQSYFGWGEEHQHPRALEADNDEPQALLGDDQAPNPVEWLLHALAGCVTTTMVFHAAARGIQVESVDTELEGDIDVRGFLGISSEVPKGYQQIRVKMHVKSDAPADKLTELAKFSPVFNTLTNPLAVQLEVEKA